MKIKFFGGYLDGQIVEVDNPPDSYPVEKPSGRKEYYDLRTVHYATKPIGNVYVLRGTTDYQWKRIIDRYVPV